MSKSSVGLYCHNLGSPVGLNCDNKVPIRVCECSSSLLLLRVIRRQFTAHLLEMKHLYQRKVPSGTGLLTGLSASRSQSVERGGIPYQTQRIRVCACVCCLRYPLRLGPSSDWWSLLRALFLAAALVACSVSQTASQTRPKGQYLSVLIWLWRFCHWLWFFGFSQPGGLGCTVCFLTCHIGICNSVQLPLDCRTCFRTD